jgi:23S rRNA pseudouridine1911/1915/1917 synthase
MTTDPIVFSVGADEAGRADRVVSRRFPWASRRRLADLFARRLVRIDGKVAKKGTLVSAGAQVAIAEPPPHDEELLPVPDGTLPVVHQDEALVAVVKPPGMPSHPLRAGEKGTAANALAAMFPDAANAGDDPREGGLVHRLDAGTSGLLLCARDRQTWLALRDAFSTGKVEKQYLALVAGDAHEGECDAALVQVGKRAIARERDGLPAHTTWKVEAHGRGVTLLRCTARTGRMHQIRAHLALAGHAIVGDALYGTTRLELPFFLHAETISLPHPRTGERLTLRAELPELLAGVLRETGIDQ